MKRVLVAIDNNIASNISYDKNFADKFITKVMKHNLWIVIPFEVIQESLSGSKKEVKHRITRIKELKNNLMDDLYILPPRSEIMSSEIQNNGIPEQIPDLSQQIMDLIESLGGNNDHLLEQFNKNMIVMKENNLKLAFQSQEKINELFLKSGKTNEYLQEIKSRIEVKFSLEEVIKKDKMFHWIIESIESFYQTRLDLNQLLDPSKFLVTRSWISSAIVLILGNSLPASETSQEDLSHFAPEKGAWTDANILSVSSVCKYFVTRDSNLRKRAEILRKGGILNTQLLKQKKFLKKKVY